MRRAALEPGLFFAQYSQLMQPRTVELEHFKTYQHARTVCQSVRKLTRRRGHFCANGAAMAADIGALAVVIFAQMVRIFAADRTGWRAHFCSRSDREP